MGASSHSTGRFALASILALLLTVGAIACQEAP